MHADAVTPQPAPGGDATDIHIVVDEDRCTGHGFCESIAEDIFEVRGDGMTHLLQQPISADRRSQLEEAVATCPTRALSLTEAGADAPHEGVHR